MAASFLGLPFAPVTLEDRAVITDFLERHPQNLSDYSFASLLAWEPIYRYHRVIVGPDTLLLFTVPGAGQQPVLLQPVGSLPESLQESLLASAGALPEPLRIESVSSEFLERYPAFVARFDAVPIRDSANYVYESRDLADLPGRRYAKKRNLIAQAARLYSWSVEALGPEHAGECLEVSDDIAKKRTAASSVTLDQETHALRRALDLFAPLRLEGLLVRVDGRPSAFSIFDHLNPTTAVVFFERALRERKGLYQVINQETARVLAEHGYAQINREEDLGDPGLRQGKLSYFPSRLEMKHTLTLRG